MVVVDGDYLEVLRGVGLGECGGCLDFGDYVVVMVGVGDGVEGVLELLVWVVYEWW